ncbi:hypothetical protein IFM89_024300, partial [Coptis chinensis]
AVASVGSILYALSSALKNFRQIELLHCPLPLALMVYFLCGAYSNYANLPLKAARRDSLIFLLLNILAVFTGLYLLFFNSISSSIYCTSTVQWCHSLTGLPLGKELSLQENGLAAPSILFALEGSGFNLVEVDDLELHKELLGRENYNDNGNGDVGYNMAEKEGCCEKAIVKDQLTVLGEEHPAHLLIRRCDFWLYYVAYFCGGTIGLVYSNNLGQIAQSLGNSPKATTLVTLIIIGSAPGKVLMTGGYLILERGNAGLVLSTNARFYAIVKPIYNHLKPDSWAWARASSSSSSSSSSSMNNALVIFILFVLCVFRDLGNPFVEQAVQYAVAAAHVLLIDKDKKDLLQKKLLQGLDITILGSNDFYSYRNQIEALGLPLTAESLASLPAFSSITFNAEASTGNNCKPEVAKTGLGSSAAMTTAVVAALLQYLGVVNLSFSTETLNQEKDDANLDLVHVVAQSAHCIAQGKIGSGFDVSAAVYGSQRYVRFSPGLLSSAQVAMKAQSLQEVISDVLKTKWDHEKTKFCLPPLMNLLLGEPGTGGSSTPSMVGAVKKWQVSEPQKSMERWQMLSEANSALETQLKLLCKFAEEQWESYEHVICSCSGLRCEQWKEQATDLFREAIVKALLGARDAVFQIRFHMRLMGKEAGVPIEPESQTQLLDATMNMEGVLLAGVPGAGGFDAVFAVTLGESSSSLTKMWSSLGVLAMLVTEDPRGVSIETDDPRASEITSSISSVHIE